MKLLKYLFIFIVLLGIGAYFAANYILDGLSREAITLARVQAVTFGVQLDKADYDRLWISSARSLTWNNLNIQFRIDGESAAFNRPEERLAMERARAKLPLERVAFEIMADDITVSITDISSGLAMLTVRDFSILPISNTLQNLETSGRDIAGKFQTGSVEGRLFETAVSIDVQDPVQSSKRMAQEFIDLARTGSTDAYIKFDGTAKMSIRGSMVEADVRTEDVGDKTVVVVDKQDIADISRLFDDKLTPPEIDIIAENPAKAPLLFTIKDYAEKTAREAFARDSTIPQDPYRHVLWSYLLTKEFGPDFAKTVTDAHEEGPTGNTRMERRQDYNNNAVGRRYVDEGVRESDILQRVRTDPKVMREWNRGSRRR